jgi:hypothetical protein
MPFCFVVMNKSDGIYFHRWTGQCAVLAAGHLISWAKSGMTEHAPAFALLAVGGSAQLDSHLTFRKPGKIIATKTKKKIFVLFSFF